LPYVNNQDVRINYEVEGEGPPLVLAHGGNDSLEMWRRYGYTDDLKKDFKLVLFDFRGHGKSDKPHEASDYGTEMAADVLAILDSLGIAKANYLGYSMGAMAGFTLATHHAARFHSFILGGMTPYEWPESMVQAARISIEGYKLLLNDPEAYLKQMERLLGRSLTPEDSKEFLSRDAEASIAVLTSLLNWPAMTDRDLTTIPVPCLIYCGELDPFHSGAKESVNHIPHAAFISLSGIDHVSVFIRSDLVIPYVRSFISLFNK